MSPRAACRLEALGFTRVYDYVDGIADWKGAGLPVEGTKDQPPRAADATRQDVPTCRPDNTIGQIRPLLTEGWDVCVVVDCDWVVVGRLRQPVLEASDEARVEEVMEPGPGTVRPDSLLEPLVDRLSQRDLTDVLVTIPQGRLLGLLIRDEAKRLLAGDTPEQIWEDCECCPGRWTTAS
jgi:Mg/Co/Ni transporter MgtE